MPIEYTKDKWLFWAKLPLDQSLRYVYIFHGMAKEVVASICYYRADKAEKRRQNIFFKYVFLFKEMWEQEKVHLEKFNQLLPQHRTRPTALIPLWDVAGFALGIQAT